MIKTPIVMAFTPNYFIPAATLILSIVRNAGRGNCFHFVCLLTEELSLDAQQKLARLTGDSCEFSFVNLADRDLDIYIDQKYTIAASYRLLLPNLLPEYDKVIYMDCDIVVQNDMAELFNLGLDENFYMAGVFEATLDIQMEHMRAIGANPGEYMNSGVLLMNLRLLREDNMVSKFLYASKSEALEFPDQDVINQLCGGKLKKIAPYWNAIRTFWLPQYKHFFLRYYSESDWRDVHRRGNIHYTGPKPWDTFTVGFGIWWYYYEQLPVEIKQMSNFNRRVYLLSRVYKTKVGKFLVDIAQTIYRNIKH